jgi:hypothetical protein
MPSYNEVDVQRAINAVENGQSLNQAAKDHRVPRTTLQGRLKGAASKKEAGNARQSLSPAEEKALAEWIRIQDALNQPPSHRQVRLAAQRMLLVSGSETKLGSTWITSFIRRNPRIKPKKGTRLEKSRAEAITPNKLMKMYAIFEEPAIKAIRAQNRWNVDETGIMDGQNRPGYFLGRAETKDCQVKTQKRSDWRSIIECISAEGNALPPTVIFSGKNVQQQWFPDDEQGQDKLKRWTFVCTDNGYTSNQVSLEWLQKVFLPMTNPGGKDWRLLVVDGHESHVSDDFLTECVANRVWLACLPSHSTHITQPLDVSVFCSLKVRYRQYVDQMALISGADALSKEDFLLCYHRAREEGITARNIRSGWRQTGLWPLDVSIPLANPRLTKPTDEAIASVTRTTPTKGDTVDCFETPVVGAQVRKQAAAIRKRSGLKPRDQQLVLRKMSKALDLKNITIADQDRQIRSLQQLVRHLQPKKRAKVVSQDPNERFITMEAVKEVKARIARQEAKKDVRIEEIATFDEIMD